MVTLRRFCWHIVTSRDKTANNALYPPLKDLPAKHHVLRSDTLGGVDSVSERDKCGSVRPEGLEGIRNLCNL